jgi:hypothetical protein
MMRSANEELLADLRDAVEERRQEVEGGKLVVKPEDALGPVEPLVDVNDPERLRHQLWRRRDTDGKLTKHGFFEGRSAWAPRNRLLDAWGREFRYEIADGRFRAISAGEDGAFGTEDDMNSDAAVSRHVTVVKRGS